MAMTLSQILDYPSSGVKRLDVPGADFTGKVELNGDTSYPTNGMPVTAAMFGLMTLKSAIPVAVTAGHTLGWDNVNQKVLLFVRTTGVEVSNTTNVSAVKIIFDVVGT